MALLMLPTHYAIGIGSFTQHRMNIQSVRIFHGPFLKQSFALVYNDCLRSRLLHQTMLQLPFGKRQLPQQRHIFNHTLNTAALLVVCLVAGAMEY